MEFKKDFEVKIDLVVEVTHYKPASPAPLCCDPSNPLFSDPGEDLEFEFILFIEDENGEKKELPNELDFLYIKLFDDIYAYYEDKFLNIF